MKIKSRSIDHNILGKSDKFIVPEKPANKTEESAAELVEERDLTKGNIHSRHGVQTQSWKNTTLGLMNVRAAALKG